jgi:glycine/D-amino acid oxidase-like deaminating enzyme
MRKERIAVVGAGAFGGWTALHLRQRGHEVVLIDAYGAGNSRSSSGDETRVIRSMYVDEIYAKMAMRAAEIWRKHEADWGQQLLYNSNVLSLVGKDEKRWAAAKGYFDQYGWGYTELDPAELQQRFPLIHLEGIEKGVIEDQSGFLLARMGCQAVLKAFVAAGGTYVVAQAKPKGIINQTMQGLQLSNGETLTADRYIFACGPWLGKLFPDEIGHRIQPTRQEIYYFGLPAETAHLWQSMPVWLDFEPNLPENTMMYGIPGAGSDAAVRGFKIGEDRAGPYFDPDTDERDTDTAWLERVRHYMHFRFPGLRHAPLSESRVCQYESTPDAHFLVDQLPTAHNAWVMGGGSGHGYKMGAALGEWMCQHLFGEVPHEPLFGFGRLEGAIVGGEMRR